MADADSPILDTSSPNVKARIRQQLDKRSFDYILRSGLAGGVAGCAAKTLIAPLDRVKILFQASNPQFIKYTGSWLGFVRAGKAIAKEDGLFGLFRGHSLTLLRIFPYAAIKFVAYEQYRALLITSREKETNLRRFLAGSFSGITSVLFTYPLEVVRVRMAFETRKHHHLSVREVCKEIYYEGSAKGGTITRLHNFYRGFIPTMVGMFPYAGVSFWTHDVVGDLLRRKSVSKHTLLRPATDDHPRPPLRVWAELTSGGVAGLASQTASYPLEVIRRRMQVGGTVGEGRFLGIFETAKTIWRTAGLRGFFVGLSIGYIKHAFMTSAVHGQYHQGTIADFINVMLAQSVKSPGDIWMIFCGTTEEVTFQLHECHDLPLKTIGNVLLANEIKTFYAHNLAHFRTLIGTRCADQHLIGIWGLLKAHELAGELAAQGLSRSIAGLVEATEHFILADVFELGTSVPILNPGVSRSHGVQTIQLRNILERWIDTERFALYT